MKKFFRPVGNPFGRAQKVVQRNIKAFMAKEAFFIQFAQLFFM